MSQERGTEKQTTIKVPLNYYYFKINSLINKKKKKPPIAIINNELLSKVVQSNI